MPAFYKITLVIAGLLMISMTVGFQFYKDYLADYENSMPQHRAQEILDTTFTPLSFARLLEQGVIPQTQATVTAFETAEDYATYMDEKLANPEVSLREKPSGASSTEKTFVIRGNNVPLFELTLKKSGESSKYGFEQWGEAAITPIAVEGPVSICCKVLRGSKLLVNDVVADARYNTEKGLATFATGHMPEGKEDLVYDVYVVSGLYRQPDITVLDPNGNSAPLVADSQSGLVTQDIVFNDGLEEKYGAFVQQAAEAYSKFMTNDGSISSVAKYFDTTTQLYDFIRKSEVVFYTDHSGYAYKDVNVSQFYGYGDNVFSGRYTATLEVYRASKTHTFNLDLTLFFTDNNGKLLVYDMVTS